MPASKKAATKKGYVSLRFLENTSYGFAADSTHAPAETIVVDGEERKAHASEQFTVGQEVDLPEEDARILIRDNCAVRVDKGGDAVAPEDEPLLADDDEQDDSDGQTVADLLQIAEQRGVHIPAGVRKKDDIKALIDDAAN